MNLEERYSVNSDQLDCEIEERDMIILAGYFDNVEHYLDIMGLMPSDQNDVRRKALTNGAQVAIMNCLLKWKQHNPSKATLRTLLEILLKLKKEEIASKVCSFYCPKPKRY